ncbi:hypothetical protein [Beduini massiliensis]|uniref:hypothetical protein n=1 Tax=Beduini massiliensis TaxID=1585974 RepID=UPI00059A9579|nr:hypothetical protein [Beduini massiliensis]
MSVENFKPTLWEGALIHNFHQVSVADALCTKPASIQGNKVIFNRIGAGAIKDYTGKIDWDAISTTPIEMTFPTKKYFAFSLEDVDKVQLKADVMSVTTSEHAALLAEQYDKDFFVTLAAGADTKNKIGSASSKKEVSQYNLYDYIVDLGVLLGKQKVPKTERFCTVDTELLGLLSKDPRFTSNPTVLANGIVDGATIGGMQIVCTECKPANQIIAHHRSAIGAAKQLDEMEAMRLQTSFADGIRGLCMYGSKELRTDAIAVMYYTVVPTDQAMKTVRVEVANTEENPIPTKDTASAGA